MKRYEFKIVIEEGCDEFWEGIEGKSACDEMTEIVRQIIYDNFGGSGVEVNLAHYSNEPDTVFNK